LALLARIFVVLFAFVLACVAAAAVMTFALLLPEWSELIDRYPINKASRSSSHCRRRSSRSTRCSRRC